MSAPQRRARVVIVGECGLRMAKVKMRASGCYRTREFAETHCRISSYLQSMKAIGHSLIAAIQIATAGKAADMIRNPQAMMPAEAGGRVDGGLAPPRPPQSRTCGDYRIRFLT